MSADESASDAAVAVAREILTECTGARIRMLSRIVTRIYDQQLRSLGIRFSQLNILVLVTDRGPIAPHEVAALLGFEKSTLSRNLRHLQQRGWMASRRAPAGNGLELTVTAEGRRLLKEAGPMWRKAQDEVRSITGEGAAAAIAHAFEHAQQLEVPK